MSKFYLLLAPLFVAASLTSMPTSAGPLLDPAFGNAGQRALNSLGGYVEGLGSCPHANGSVSVLGYRATTTSLVTVRLKANGDLDTSFSGDGIHEQSLFTSLASDRSATACVGVGNAAPEDDRIMVVATSPASNDRVVAALIDLNTGGYDSNFYLGGPAQYDVSGLLFPPQSQVWPYPRVKVRGVFPGPGNGWLIVGQLDGHSSGIPAGFIARVNAGGAIDALAHPAVGGFNSRDLNAARVGPDGDIRVLGSGLIGGAITWGLLRLDPLSLQPVALSSSGVADIFEYRVLKGRQIGGGLMVAAGLKNDSSAFGVSPRLLIVRGDSVVDLALPAPPALDGLAVGPNGLDGSAAATGAVNNRAVFAMGLNSLSNASVGYYAAVVQLGDGAGVADAVDVRFASNGAGSFRYRPLPTTCAAGMAPPQRFSNIASWGDATLLVGSTAPDCIAGIDSSMLTARLLTDGERLHRDGFEASTR